MPSRIGSCIPMTESPAPIVAVVDFGVGNLFSVQSACRVVGLDARLTSLRHDVLNADGVIVPGVGAFGDAMAALERLDLVSPLRDLAAAGTPLLGVCLGMQLFMTESEEFGRHRGLGLFDGPVVRFRSPRNGARELKVPQVGWNQIRRTEATAAGNCSSAGLLRDIPDGVFMYFVHSYYAQPTTAADVVTTTHYGDVEFCSSIGRRNVFACQFHPERSGVGGLQFYRNFAQSIPQKNHV